jgi:heavy metal sensor kinase
MNTRSLRFQLGLWHAGLLAGVFGLLGAAMIFLLRHYLESSVRDAQLRRARQIAQALSPKLVAEGRGRVAEEIEARFLPAVYNRFVRVCLREGTVIYRSNSPQDKSFDPETVPLTPWPDRTDSSHKVILPGGMPMLIVAHVLWGPNGKWLLVESGAPLDSVQAMLRQVILAMALTLLAAVAIASAGGYFLVGRALATVDQIARSAERISVQNLSERLPIAQSGDEVERLSLALNRMIQRLEEAFQHSKRFVADASHELRTPLTVLRGELETLVARESLAPAVQDRLGSVLEEVDRLSNLVEGLLTLSRLDAGEAKREWVTLDLAQLAVSTADQMSLLAEDKRIKMNCDTPAPVLVQGDRTRLKQVIVNLLDNAIKYTSENGTIRISVRSTDGQALLEVLDNGIGIPMSVLPHVFERFFRADKARSRDFGGAGLGLAIVRSICLAHDGKVEVQSTEGRGSRFTIELPLAVTLGSESKPAGLDAEHSPGQPPAAHASGFQKQRAIPSTTESGIQRNDG